MYVDKQISIALVFLFVRASHHVYREHVRKRTGTSTLNTSVRARRFPQWIVAYNRFRSGRASENWIYRAEECTGHNIKFRPPETKANHKDCTNLVLNEVESNFKF